MLEQLGTDYPGPSGPTLPGHASCRRRRRWHPTGAASGTAAMQADVPVGERQQVRDWPTPWQARPGDRGRGPAQRLVPARSRKSGPVVPTPRVDRPSSCRLTPALIDVRSGGTPWTRGAAASGQVSMGGANSATQEQHGSSGDLILGAPARQLKHLQTPRWQQPDERVTPRTTGLTSGHPSCPMLLAPGSARCCGPRRPQWC